jgi:hypothetical protein
MRGSVGKPRIHLHPRSVEEGSAHGDVERVEPAGDEGAGREVPHEPRRDEARENRGQTGRFPLMR